MKVDIGGIKFKGGSSALDFAKRIIQENGEGKIDRSHSMWEFFRELLKRHYEHGAVKPEYFLIQRNFSGSLEMAFVLDGKPNVFSVRSCVAGFPLDKLNRAMRFAIKDQTDAVPTPEYCQLCAYSMSPREKIHIDHLIPFKKLKADFMKTWTGKVPSSFRELRDAGGFVFFLEEDAAFRDAWAKYHKEHAKLRAVHARCNLKRRMR